MLIRDDSNRLGQYQPDLPYAAPQPGGGPTESSNLYPFMKQYGYPDVQNAPASLWTNYPARGMPSSPGETDEWSPLPAQGSAYAGKGVTMPDVATHGLGDTAMAIQERKEDTAVRIGGFFAAGFNALYTWYFFRTAKYERKRLLRYIGYMGVVGSSLGVAQGLWMMTAPRTYNRAIQDRYAMVEGNHKRLSLDPLSAMAVEAATNKTMSRSYI